MRSVLALGVAAAAIVLVSGCGSGASGPVTPTIAPAKTYRLVGFQPSGPVEAGRPVWFRFKIVEPSGATLTRYRTGPGPHTGVDLVIVRQGADALIYTDTTLGKDGVARELIKLPAPGRYRVVVDAYPNQPGVPRNFQLFRTVTTNGDTRAPVLPLSTRSVTVDGYRYTIQKHAALRAIQPAFLTIDVTGRRGQPARFQPIEGALAHAIFIRFGTLDYFHTHVCSPSLPGCTSLLGGPPVGKAAGAGKLRIGSSCQLPGTWRLFLLTKPDGRVITAAARAPRRSLSGLHDLQRGAARRALVSRRILGQHAELELRRLQGGRHLPRDRARLPGLRLAEARRDRGEEEVRRPVDAHDLAALPARVVDRVTQRGGLALRARERQAPSRPERSRPCACRCRPSGAAS